MGLSRTFRLRGSGGHLGLCILCRLLRTVGLAAPGLGCPRILKPLRLGLCFGWMRWGLMRLLTRQWIPRSILICLELIDDLLLAVNDLLLVVNDRVIHSIADLFPYSFCFYNFYSFLYSHTKMAFHIDLWKSTLI